MRGQAHSDETKAAVIAALLTGQSISQVAKDYKLDRKTVRAWRDTAGIEDSPESPKVPPQKKAELGDLIVDYLREVLVTLRVQAEQFRDPAWLKAQPASEAAILHGVLTDKAVRILEALDAGEEQPPDI